MTNLDLLENKLAFIERTVRELRALSNPDRIEHDLREQRFAERELQLAIQAALDVASHIVSDARTACRNRKPERGSLAVLAGEQAEEGVGVEGAAGGAFDQRVGVVAVAVLVDVAA